jgi:uncharacterized protein (DUF58 family)
MSEPDDALSRSTPAPRPVAGRPTTRTWVLWGVWRALLIGVAGACALVADGALRWLWLLLLAGLLLTTWFFRPGRTVGVRVPPALSRPGDHRVVLQLPGDKPVQVVAALRRITGADLRTAKQMLESAPVVVAEGLSQDSAAEAVHLLTSAGARATLSEMEPRQPMDPAP